MTNRLYDDDSVVSRLSSVNPFNHFLHIGERNSVPNNLQLVEYLSPAELPRFKEGVTRAHEGVYTPGFSKGYQNGGKLKLKEYGY